MEIWNLLGLMVTCVCKSVPQPNAESRKLQTSLYNRSYQGKLCWGLLVTVERKSTAPKTMFQKGMEEKANGSAQKGPKFPNS